MKVALLHYHLKTGGVTSVLHRQAECIHSDCDVLIISGSPAGPAFPFPVSVIEAIGYDRSDRSPPSPAAVAAEIDTAVRAGEELGSLFCVPMLVKDNFDTHDMITSGGSIALIDNYPPDDAFMVRRIREAGAIVIAKTNMAEWAFSPRQTVSSSYGRTANVYDIDYVPAGSSGGTTSAPERPPCSKLCFRYWATIFALACSRATWPPPKTLPASPLGASRPGPSDWCHRHSP